MSGHGKNGFHPHLEGLESRFLLSVAAHDVLNPGRAIATFDYRATASSSAKEIVSKAHSETSTAQVPAQTNSLDDSFMGLGSDDFDDLAAEPISIHEETEKDAPDDQAGNDMDSSTEEQEQTEQILTASIQSSTTRNLAGGFCFLRSMFDHSDATDPPSTDQTSSHVKTPRIADAPTLGGSRSFANFGPSGFTSASGPIGSSSRDALPLSLTPIGDTGATTSGKYPAGDADQVAGSSDQAGTILGFFKVPSGPVFASSTTGGFFKSQFGIEAVAPPPVPQRGPTVRRTWRRSPGVFE